MSYLKSYVDSLDNCGLQQSVLATSNAVYDNVQKHFDCRISTTGLLLGNVQSGKTGQMLGIMSKLADEGYLLFILLTTDNVDLQRQTYNRVLNSLPVKHSAQIGNDIRNRPDRLVDLFFRVFRPDRQAQAAFRLFVLQPDRPQHMADLLASGCARASA